MNSPSHAERWSTTRHPKTKPCNDEQWTPPLTQRGGQQLVWSQWERNPPVGGTPPLPPPPHLTGNIPRLRISPTSQGYRFFPSGPEALNYTSWVLRQGSRWLDFNKCQRLGIWLLNKWHWKILKLIYLKRVFILKPFIPSFWRLQKTLEYQGVMMYYHTIFSCIVRKVLADFNVRVCDVWRYCKDLYSNTYTV